VIQKNLSSSILVAAFFAASGASANMVTDMHGNVGYDTAAECDAAVNAGTAKFYKSYTNKPPMLRAGEKRVQAMALRDLQTKDYSRGACDIGVGRRAGRDGVDKVLQGKYVPYSPDMPVNVYLDNAGMPVRASMRQCDNWFGANMPRPVSAAPVANKPMTAPATTANVTPVTPMAPAPQPMRLASNVSEAMATAKGAIGTREILGAAGVVAVAAILLNDGTSGTGTTK
jgi:hypothetical protein